MLGVGPVEFRLIWAWINREQQIALLDLLALLEMHLVEITAHARPQLDGLRGFETSDIIVPLDDLTGDRLDDRNNRRRRSGLCGMLSTACHQQSDRERSNRK